ncbi:MAG: nucleotidyltransferase domain-containing protein [Bacteroidota bacterium]
MVNRETALNIAKSFVDECLANGLHFYKVFLFGSAARNQANEWSDIDLLLVSDAFNDNIFDNLKLYSSINIKYPIIETHPYPTKYFLEGDDFINEISKHSVEVII